MDPNDLREWVQLLRRYLDAQLLTGHVLLGWAVMWYWSEHAELPLEVVLVLIVAVGLLIGAVVATRIRPRRFASSIYLLAVLVVWALCLRYGTPLLWCIPLTMPHLVGALLAWRWGTEANDGM
jgi:ribose/xylose/arabinose/galactoside ABC-type transport system permease subunit